MFFCFFFLMKLNYLAYLFIRYILFINLFGTIFLGTTYKLIKTIPIFQNK